jgi:hypothetical protein
MDFFFHGQTSILADSVASQEVYNGFDGLQGFFGMVGTAGCDGLEEGRESVSAELVAADFR